MNRQLHKQWMGVLGALLLAALAISGCGVLGSAASDSADQSQKSIAVSGFGDATGSPDIAMVQLGVETKADSIAQAIETSNQTVQQVTQALLDFGIAATDLQSTNFNVWYQEDYDPATGQPTGVRTYHVDSTLSVKVRDIGRISATIQAGLDAGANNVFGLSYGIDDSKSLESEARAQALEDAHDRAQQLASSLGLTLGDPIIVSELVGGSSLLSEAAAVRGLGLGGGGGGPPLSPGELTVSIQIDVMYSIEG